MIHGSHAAQADEFVDHEARRGAAVIRPGSELLNAVTQLFAWHAQVIGSQVCEHIARRGLGFAFFPLCGPDAFHFVCLDCYTEPPAADGCGYCRQQPPEVRSRLVICRAGSGVVVVGRLCAQCRAGRLISSSSPAGHLTSSTAGDLDVEEPGPSPGPGSNVSSAPHDRGPHGRPNTPT